MKGEIAAAIFSYQSSESLFLENDHDRELAVTRGKIADILRAQGELDLALEMHLSRLPDAQERKDAASIAHIRYSCAKIRFSRGDHQRGELQLIHYELAEAFGIMAQIGRADGIGGIGTLFAQVLATGGQKDKALAVLGPAREAFERLGNTQGLAHCDQLSAMISEGNPT